MKSEHLIFALVLGVLVGCGHSETTGSHSVVVTANPMSDKQTPEQAYQQLLSIAVFAFGGVGYAGITSEGEKAFQTIVVSTNALALFTAAITNGNPAARLYGLCGLRRLAPEKFDSPARTLVAANPRVEMMSGCLLTEDRASNVVAQIMRGQYDSYINRQRK